MEEYDLLYVDRDALRARRLAALRAQMAEADELMRVARDGVALLEAARTALAMIEDVLRDMRGLAERAAAPDCPDRTRLNERFQAMKGEIAEIAAASQYQGVNLLDGSVGSLEEIIAALEEELG